MTKVKRQHYVWRNYLRSWSSKDQICCARDQKIFPANLMKVAQKKNFYTSEPITEEDELVIRKVAIDSIKNPLMKQSAEEWIKFAKVPTDVMSFANQYFPDEKDLREELEVNAHNYGEHLQSKIENEGAPFLQLLLKEDMSFFENENDRHSFGMYLGFQYFRTRQMLERICYDPDGRIKKINVPRIWPVLRNIFSTNMGWGLVNNPDNLRLIYLRNETNLNFLTSDQPAINTYVDYRVFEPTDKFELYYPLSPTQGILLSEKSIYKKYQIVRLNNIDDVVNLNMKIINASFEQVFSDSESTLRLYFPSYSI